MTRASLPYPCRASHALSFIARTYRGRTTLSARLISRSGMTAVRQRVRLDAYALTSAHSILSVQGDLRVFFYERRRAGHVVHVTHQGSAGLAA